MIAGAEGYIESVGEQVRGLPEEAFSEGGEVLLTVQDELSRRHLRTSADAQELPYASLDVYSRPQYDATGRPIEGEEYVSSMDAAVANPGRLPFTVSTAMDRRGKPSGIWVESVKVNGKEVPMPVVVKGAAAAAIVAVANRRLKRQASKKTGE